MISLKMTAVENLVGNFPSQIALDGTNQCVGGQISRESYCVRKGQRATGHTHFFSAHTMASSRIHSRLLASAKIALSEKQRVHS